MKRKLMIKLAAVVLVLVCAILSAINLQKADGVDVLWMAEVSDSARLNSLSIPGTHDSGALHSIADVAGKCQTLSIKEQLKIGVRFFDIRLKLNGEDELKVVHSFVDQGVGFDEILRDMSGFLKDNPSEFLIVSIKEDADSESENKTFSEAVSDNLYRYTDVVSFSKTLPETVGGARGKIHIISRYGGGEIGIQMHSGWKDSQSFELGNIYVQDNYRIEDIEVKKSDVTTAFEKSATEAFDLVLNFTSCYFDYGFPPMYSAPPAKIINPWLIESLDEVEGSLGVVICDYMTKELSQAIYGRSAK